MFFQLIVLALASLCSGTSAGECRSDGVRWGSPFSQWYTASRAQARGKTKIAVSASGKVSLDTLAVTLRDGSDCIVRPHEETYLEEDSVIIFCRQSPLEPWLFSGEYTAARVNRGEGEK